METPKPTRSTSAVVKTPARTWGNPNGKRRKTAVSEETGNIALVLGFRTEELDIFILFNYLIIARAPLHLLGRFTHGRMVFET